jgi:hypothetical protein
MARCSQFVAKTKRRVIAGVLHMMHRIWWKGELDGLEPEIVACLNLISDRITIYGCYYSLRGFVPSTELAF